MKFLSDENCHGPMIDALRLHLPFLDLERAVDVGLLGADDSAVLTYAAEVRKIVLTHDKRTMIGLAKKRIAAGEVMPGLIVIPTNHPIPDVIETIRVFNDLGTPDEFVDRIFHLSSKRG